MKGIHERISAALNASELSSAQLQKLTNHSRPAVADRLSGRTRWSLHDAAVIAPRLGITLDELVTGKAPDPPAADEHLADVVELPEQVGRIEIPEVDELLTVWAELDTRSQLRARRDYPQLVGAVESLRDLWES